MYVYYFSHNKYLHNRKTEIRKSSKISENQKKQAKIMFGNNKSIIYPLIHFKRKSLTKLSKWAISN